MSDTRPVNVSLLRPIIECGHNPDSQRTASDCVIYQDGEHEIARQVIFCTECGWVVEVRDVERDHAEMLEWQRRQRNQLRDPGGSTT